MTNEDLDKIRNNAKAIVETMPSLSFNEKVAYIDGYTEASMRAIAAIEKLKEEKEVNEDEDRGDV